MQLSVPNLPVLPAAPGAAPAVSTGQIPEAALEVFGAVLLAASQPPAAPILPTVEGDAGLMPESTGLASSLAPNPGAAPTAPGTGSMRLSSPVDPHGVATRSAPGADSVRTVSRPGAHSVPTRSALSPDSSPVENATESATPPLAGEAGPQIAPSLASGSTAVTGTTPVPSEAPGRAVDSAAPETTAIVAPAAETAAPVAGAVPPTSASAAPAVTKATPPPAAQGSVTAPASEITTPQAPQVVSARATTKHAPPPADQGNAAAPTPEITTARTSQVVSARAEAVTTQRVAETLLPEVAAIAGTFTRSAPADRISSGVQKLDTAPVPVAAVVPAAQGASAAPVQAATAMRPVQMELSGSLPVANAEIEPAAQPVAISPEAQRSIETYRAHAKKMPGEAQASASEHPEKIAVSTARSASFGSADAQAVKKDWVVPVNEGVAQATSKLGTRAAKSDAPMPVLFSHEYASPVFRAEPLPNTPLAAVAFEPFVGEGLGAEVEQVATARRAVAATLETVQQFSTADARGVNLKFSVSGTDLAVHVAMRGGEIQTTFRTESPELRAALATEWRSVTGQFEAGAQRLAEPVFSASSSSSSVHADAGSAHREGRSAQQQEPPAAPFRFSSSVRESAASAQAAAPAVSITPAPLPTTRRLHAFA